MAQPIPRWPHSARCNLRGSPTTGLKVTRFNVVAACELLEEGVTAIFGPSSPYTYGIVASIAARFDVPHVDYFWRQNEELQDGQQPKNPMPMTTNVFPDSDMVSKVSTG